MLQFNIKKCKMVKAKGYKFKPSHMMLYASVWIYLCLHICVCSSFDEYRQIKCPSECMCRDYPVGVKVDCTSRNFTFLPQELDSDIVTL